MVWARSDAVPSFVFRISYAHLRHQLSYHFAYPGGGRWGGDTIQDTSFDAGLAFPPWSLRFLYVVQTDVQYSTKVFGV